VKGARGVVENRAFIAVSESVCCFVLLTDIVAYEKTKNERRDFFWILVTERGAREY